MRQGTEEEKKLSLTLKRQDIEIEQIFMLKNCAKFGLELVPDGDPEPETKLFQSRNPNRNKSLRFHNIECNTVPYKIDGLFMLTYR